MIDFTNLPPEELTGLSITLPLAHLFEIVEHTVERAVDKFKEEILPAHKPVDQDPLIPRLEVMRILGVCANTLRNWRKSKYLEATLVGSKVYYRTSAVQAVLEKYGKERN